jgi:hypothetical protein
LKELFAEDCRERLTERKRSQTDKGDKEIRKKRRKEKEKRKSNNVWIIFLVGPGGEEQKETIREARNPLDIYTISMTVISRTTSCIFHLAWMSDIAQIPSLSLFCLPVDPLGRSKKGLRSRRSACGEAVVEEKWVEESTHYQASCQGLAVNHCRCSSPTVQAGMVQKQITERHGY